MVSTDVPPSIGSARYDGYAQWYDGWSQSAASPFMAAAQQVLEELAPDGGGLAVDLGCGTGLSAAVAGSHGFHVVGVDVSADQLRLARSRLPVVLADARAVPLVSGSARWVYSMLTHTDLDSFDRLVAEGVRLLAPGGSFVHVGLHPCFVNPVAEPLPDGVRLHPGYRHTGWQPPGPFRSATGVQHRVGVHHLPLDGLLTALIHPDAPLDRVVERGGGAVPDLLGVRLTRPAVRAPADTR